MYCKSLDECIKRNARRGEVYLMNASLVITVTAHCLLLITLLFSVAVKGFKACEYSHSS